MEISARRAQRIDRSELADEISGYMDWVYDEIDAGGDVYGAVEDVVEQIMRSHGLDDEETRDWLRDRVDARIG